MVTYMKTLPLAEVRQRLSEVVSDVERYHEHVVVTKNGRPAAVLVSADEWEEIEETEFWRSQPGVMEDIKAAREDIARGDYVTADELMAGLKRRHRDTA